MGATVLLAALLWGPCATWLQARHLWWKAGGEAPDVIYLVAGADAQPDRLDAVLKAARRWPRSRIWIGNDTTMGLWSRQEQRNPSMAEWALLKLQGSGGGLGLRGRIVPGRFAGTDGEMEALARELGARTEVERIVLVTSSFHVRRVAAALAAHLGRPVTVTFITPRPGTSDRFPWRVAVELAKLLRDEMGLARHPLLSRPLPGGGCGR